jgi:signal transduction histidine kinase
VTVPVLLLAILSGFLRYRRAEGVEREQMKWPILALILFLIMVVVRLLIPELETKEVEWGYPITWTMAMLFPISIGIGILRKGLWDIDIVISRTLIYGSLSAVIIMLYIAIVGFLGRLFQTQTNALSGLIAAAVIAVLFQPLREFFQQRVNRLLFGERDDPAAVLTRLAQDVEAAETPTEILPSLVQTIARTLKIPYTAIWLSVDGEAAAPAAAWGEEPDQTEMIPLTYRQETIGYLVVAPRGPQEAFTRYEQDLLAAIAALTVTAVRSVQLADELRISRRRIITAREDERRRLRRDLHDGLGPQLASQTLGLEAVAQLMASDPEKARDLLVSLMAQAQEATLDVRRIVYDLRPPALDDLGLLGALQQSAARYEISGPRFAMDVQAPLPDLPAAVETAVYRITQEAMTNVVRHAEATDCNVRLFSENGRLIVEIEDNGRGLPAGQPSGVGLQAMKERAAELNGRLTLGPAPGSGTLVHASLPLESNGE